MCTSVEQQRKFLLLLRQSKGWSTQQVAYAARLELSDYLQLEAGKRNLRAAELNNLAEAYSLHPDALLWACVNEQALFNNYAEDAPSVIALRQLLHRLLEAFHKQPKTK